MGVLVRNLCGNPPGTYYYVQGLLKHVLKLRAQLKEAEECLVRVQMNAVTVIPAREVEDFLIIAENQKRMNSGRHFGLNMTSRG